MRWYEPTTGMEFIRVEAGEFEMGLRPDEPSDTRPAPVHAVAITKSFYMGRFEVTQAQWARVMDTAPSQFVGCGECPVESVSWHEAQAFLRRLENANPGERFRLPTEAEWEYACRAGSNARYGGSDTLGPGLANYDGRIPFDGIAREHFVGHPVAVGSYPPNAWGFQDLQGNVWEWAQDEYCPYPRGGVTDPVGRCGTDTIPIRGGSWHFSADAARCGRRFTHARGDSGFSLGFRIVREIPEPETSSRASS